MRRVDLAIGIAIVAGAVLLLTSTVSAGPTPLDELRESGWIQVVERSTAAQDALQPVSELLAGVHPTAQVQGLWVRDEGSVVALRFAGNVSEGAVTSRVDWRHHAPFGEAWDEAAVEADGTTFGLRLANHGGKDSTRIQGGSAGFQVIPGSSADDYEVRVRRDLISRGEYIRGEAWLGFQALVEVRAVAAIAQDSASSDEDLRWLPLSSGNTPGDDGPAGPRWKPFPMRVDRADAALAVGVDQTLHVAFVGPGASAYFDRPADATGLYYARLSDGAWHETFVAPMAGDVNHTRMVEMVLVDDRPHILYYGTFPERGALLTGKDAVMHAWLDGAAWRTAPVVPEGGPAIDMGSRLPPELETDGRRLLAVLPLEDAMGVFEHTNGQWTLLRSLPGTVSGRLTLDHTGVYHVLAMGETRYAPRRDDNLIEATPLLAMYREGLEQSTREWHGFSGWDGHRGSQWLDVPYDLVSVDDTLCIFWATPTPGDANLRCLDGRINETIPFLVDDQRPLSTVRLEATADGTIHMLADAYGWWSGARSPGGQWWWESQPLLAADATLLPDGRVVVLGPENGGYRGLMAAVQQPHAHDRPEYAFWSGLAKDAPAADASYRPAVQGAAGQAVHGGAGEPGQSAPGAPTQEGTTVPGTRDAPTPGVLPVMASLLLGVLVRKAVQGRPPGRRRPRHPPQP